MLYIGCIADDFTGAGDAASFIRKGGLNTLYLNGDSLDEGPLPPETEAVVIALKCRSIPAAQAVAQVSAACRWLLDRGAAQIYYKYCSTFDSTAEGNIGPVTDALLALLGADYTLLCPALPVNGRTVRNGLLYVNGVPLAESPMRLHPLNPMTQSALTRLMAPQSRNACFAMDRETLYADEAVRSAFLDECRAAGRFSLAVDYAEDADGARIAALFGDLPLLTGGSGLLEHLSRRRRGQAPAAAGEESRPPAGPRLLLAGSCSEMTRRQIAAYAAAGGRTVRIDPIALLEGRQSVEELERALDEAEGELLLYSSDEAEQVEKNQRYGAERVSALLEETMGRLAAYAQARGVRRIVVAGGETSGRVMLSLGYKRYRVLEDAAPGVPRMCPVEKPELSLALKSGNFGAEDFFLTALNE